MQKLKMQTGDIADENFRKLAELFPNAVTETLDENGEVVRAIDKDVLMQEISARVVEGTEERYQFTWPDKRKAVRLASTPVAAALRPCREESVDFDTTENLYIEGDNLDVLKLLRETYLGKVKMIYIDPPYNRGDDLVYRDDFSESSDDFLYRDGQFDDCNNRMLTNNDSSGRFHTNWLNMIYPRLKIARDLLRDDGIIFISIGDDELVNLQKICNEIFGVANLLGQINIVTGANQSGEGVLIQKNVEYCLAYAKSKNNVKIFRVDKTEESWRNLNDAPTPLSTRTDMGYTIYYNPQTGDMKPLFDYNRSKISTNSISEVYTDDSVLIASGYIPVRPGFRNGVLHRWRWGIETFELRKNGIKMFKNNNSYIPKFKQEGFNAPKNIQSFTGGTNDLKGLFGNQTPFDYPKGVSFMSYLCSIGSRENDIILDFFSGSATIAQAIMQLNRNEGSERRFIMVQFPEDLDKALISVKGEGEKTIESAIRLCDSLRKPHLLTEIGKERIRRAGKKIKEELQKTAQAQKEEDPLFASAESTGATDQLDIGFRVLKLDSTNMKEVYYNPAETSQDDLLSRVSNIKPDRTPEDLLFQVMLELGVLPSSRIEKSIIAGKQVFDVADNFLIACFDDNVTDEVVTAIAKRRPVYAVLRDSSFSSDSVAANFEQIFAAFSPDTVRRVL